MAKRRSYHTAGFKLKTLELAQLKNIVPPGPISIIYIVSRSQLQALYCSIAQHLSIQNGGRRQEGLGRLATQD